jgi:phage baseplate assembly protein W
MNIFDQNTEIRASIQKDIYVDFDMSFRRNPTSNDLALRKDVESIKQSVINILLTKRGERPFEPFFGGNIHKYLFENFDEAIKLIIENDIKSTLETHEPRIKVNEVNIIDHTDTQNAIHIDLSVEIIVPKIRTTMQIIVQRMR